MSNPAITKLYLEIICERKLSPACYFNASVLQLKYNTGPGVLTHYYGLNYMVQHNYVRIHGIFAIEGCSTNKKFEYEYSNSPQICRSVMPLIEDNFWSHIVWGTTECPCLFVVCDHFGESEVYDLNVSRVSDHQVLWFQITIDQILWSGIADS